MCNNNNNNNTIINFYLVKKFSINLYLLCHLCFDKVCCIKIKNIEQKKMFERKNIGEDFISLFSNQAFVNIAILCDTEKDKDVYFYHKTLKIVKTMQELVNVMELARNHFKNRYCIYLKLNFFRQQQQKQLKNEIENLLVLKYEPSQQITTLDDNIKDSQSEQQTSEIVNHRDLKQVEFYKHIDSFTSIYRFQIDNRNNTSLFDSIINEKKTLLPAAAAAATKQRKRKSKLIIPARLIQKTDSYKYNKNNISSAIVIKDHSDAFSSSFLSQLKRRKNLMDNTEHDIRDVHISNHSEVLQKNNTKNEIQIDEKLYHVSELKEEYVDRKIKPLAINIEDHVFDVEKYERERKLKLREKRKRQYTHKYNERNILQVRTMTKHMNWVRSGKKKKEARISKNIFTKVQTGDIICFFNDYDTTVFCVVENIVVYKTFREMFLAESVDSFLPFLKKNQIKKALDVYYSFKNYKQQEERFGVVCFHLNNDVPQEKEYYYSNQ